MRIVNVIIYIIVEIVAASYRNVFRHEEVAFLGQWLETPGFSWKGVSNQIYAPNSYLKEGPAKKNIRWTSQ